MRHAVGWSLLVVWVWVAWPVERAVARGGRPHSSAPHAQSPRPMPYHAPRPQSMPHVPQFQPNAHYNVPQFKPGVSGNHAPHPHAQSVNPRSVAKAHAGSGLHAAGNGLGSGTNANLNTSSANGSGAYASPAPFAWAWPHGISGGPRGYAYGSGMGVHRNYASSGYHRGYRGPYRSNQNSQMYARQQARMRRLWKLVDDLDALGPGVAVGVPQRDVLRNDLHALAQGGYRPAGPPLQSLAVGLVDALPTRRNRPLDTARLAGDLEVVVNGGRLPAATVGHAVGDAARVMKSSGVAPAGLRQVETAMRSLGTAGGLAVGVR